MYHISKNTHLSLYVHVSDGAHCLLQIFLFFKSSYLIILLIAFVFFLNFLVIRKEGSSFYMQYSMIFFIIEENHILSEHHVHMVCDTPSFFPCECL